MTQWFDSFHRCEFIEIQYTIIWMENYRFQCFPLAQTTLLPWKSENVHCKFLQLVVELKTIHRMTKTHKMRSLRMNSVVYCLDIRNAIFALQILFMYVLPSIWVFHIGFFCCRPFYFLSFTFRFTWLCVEHFHRPTQSATIYILWNMPQNKYWKAISFDLVVATKKQTDPLYFKTFVCENPIFKCFVPYRWYPRDVFDGTWQRTLKHRVEYYKTKLFKKLYDARLAYTYGKIWAIDVKTIHV